MRNKAMAWMVAVLAAVGCARGAELPVTGGLFLRLDGSSVTLDGSSVTAWSNLVSGTGVSQGFVQADAAKRPTLITNALNGYAVINFDGSNDYLENVSDSAWDWDWDSDPADAARWTTFFVFQSDADQQLDSNRQHLMRSAYADIQEGSVIRTHDEAWGAWLYKNDCKVHGRTSAGAYSEVVTNNAFKAYDWNVLAGRLESAATPTLTLSLNGGFVSNANSVTRQMTGHVRSRIGALGTAAGGQCFNGRLAEVIVYKEALSDSQIAEVNAYLFEKYKIADRLGEGLALHCRMDDAYARRGVTRPPPALSTADGEWTVKSTVEPAYNGTAKSYSTAGTVVSSVSGVIGESIMFSDSTAGDRRVDFGDIDSLEADEGSLSVALWFKASMLETNVTQIVASHGNESSGTTGWSFWFSGSNLNMRVCNGFADSNKASLTYDGIATGQWYHVVMVIDRHSGKLEAYVNGSQEGIYITYPSGWGDDISADPLNSTKPLVLGIRNTNDLEFRGGIDDFAIWKRALTPYEVAVIYELGLQGKSFVPEPPPKGTLIRCF